MEHEQLAIQTDGNRVVIKLKGQFIGGDETEALRQICIDRASDSDGSIVLDVSTVTYGSSSFLSVLLAAHSAATRHGSTFIVVGATGVVKNALKLTAMDRIIQQVASLSDLELD